MPNAYGCAKIQSVKKASATTSNWGIYFPATFRRIGKRLQNVALALANFRQIAALIYYGSARSHGGEDGEPGCAFDTD
jgi:hypothetical protein